MPSVTSLQKVRRGRKTPAQVLSVSQAKGETIFITSISRDSMLRTAVMTFTNGLRITDLVRSRYKHPKSYDVITQAKRHVGKRDPSLLER